MKYLKDDKFYMDPFFETLYTGKVWNEMYDQDKFVDDPNDPMTWEDWGGDDLIEVRWIDNKWEEVE